MLFDSRIWFTHCSYTNTTIFFLQDNTHTHIRTQRIQLSKKINSCEWTPDSIQFTEMVELFYFARFSLSLIRVSLTYLTWWFGSLSTTLCAKVAISILWARPRELCVRWNSAEVEYNIYKHNTHNLCMRARAPARTFVIRRWEKSERKRIREWGLQPRGYYVGSRIVDDKWVSNCSNTYYLRFVIPEKSTMSCIYCVNRKIKWIEFIK